MTDESERVPVAEAEPVKTRLLPTWAVWTVYPLAVIAMLGLLALVFFEAFSREIPFWGKLLVMGFVVIAVAAWFFERREVLAAPRGLGKRLRDGHTLQAALALVLLAASVLPNVLGLIRPAAAIENRPGEIRDGVAYGAALGEAANEKLDEIVRTLPGPPPEDAPVRERIAGLWGEAGCVVVWRIGLEGNALTAEVVRKPEGLPDYAFTASVISAEDMTLQAVGEQPAEAKGMAATFVLDESGAAPLLSWSDRVRRVPLVLEPCD